MKTVEQIIRDGKNPDAVFVEIDHPDRVTQWWSGLGFIDWDGKTWAGVGSLGAISVAPSDTSVAVTDVTFTLSGVSPEILAGLSERVDGATAKIWKVWLSEKWTVAYAELIQECELDQQMLDVKDGSASVTITANGGFFYLERQTAAVWDPEHQRDKLISMGIDPATDTGFDMMHQMRSKNLAWLP